MLDGPSVLAALRTCGVSHVVWIPDSDTGRWEQVLAQAPDLALIRVCREGEAIAVAAGLLLGGKTPIVVMQCTGLFEAGDALRNVVHDLHLPLFLIVGVRNLIAHRQGTSRDSCPRFAEPIVQTWLLPYLLFEEKHGQKDLIRLYQQARSQNQPFVVLLPE
jgi:sulfopyruvate decarboxylase TPP-binding subunit